MPRIVAHRKHRSHGRRLQPWPRVGGVATICVVLAASLLVRKAHRITGEELTEVVATQQGTIERGIATPAIMATNSSPVASNMPDAPERGQAIAKEGATVPLAPNGPRLETVPPSEWRQFLKPSGFTGGPVEGLLCMMASASVTGSLPPLPLGSEDELRKGLERALAAEIEVFDDDPPEVARLKEDVASMKQQLAEVVEGGGSIRDALLEYEDWIRECDAARREVSDKYRQIKSEASEDVAEAYLAEANADLEGRGIPPLNIGKSRTRDRSRRDARLRAVREAQRAALEARESKGAGQ